MMNASPEARYGRNDYAVRTRPPIHAPDFPHIIHTPARRCVDALYLPHQGARS